MGVEQTTIRGVVRSLDGENAIVEPDQGGCGRCHEKGGCGGQQLTQIFCAGQKTYHVENSIGAAVGDSVTIAIAAGSVRRTANLAYGIPLVATILGAAFGSLLGSDLWAILGGAFGFITSYIYVILRSRGDEAAFANRPHIISR